MSTFETITQGQNNESLSLFQKIKNKWLKYGHKIILAAGIILIAAISFEAGFLHGQKNQKDPIEMNISHGVSSEDISKSIASTAANKEQQNNSSDISNNELAAIGENDNKNCPYMASKNSNKFHLSSCQWAKRIKPENRICFPSREEAEKKGYQGAKCCIK